MTTTDQPTPAYDAGDAAPLDGVTITTSTNVGQEPTRVGHADTPDADHSQCTPALCSHAAGAALRPAITVNPALAFGRPTIRGISTVAIAGAVASGDGVTGAMDDYGLTRHEVLLACWHEGIQGERLQQWRDWATRVHGPLGGWASLDVDALPDPPETTATAADAAPEYVRAAAYDAYLNAESLTASLTESVNAAADLAYTAGAANLASARQENDYLRRGRELALTEARAAGTRVEQLDAELTALHHLCDERTRQRDEAIADRDRAQAVIDATRAFLRAGPGVVRGHLAVALDAAVDAYDASQPAPADPTLDDALTDGQIAITDLLATQPPHPVPDDPRAQGDEEDDTELVELAAAAIPQPMDEPGCEHHDPDGPLRGVLQCHRCEARRVLAALRAAGRLAGDTIPDHVLRYIATAIDPVDPDEAATHPTLRAIAAAAAQLAAHTTPTRETILNLAARLTLALNTALAHVRTPATRQHRQELADCQETLVEAVTVLHGPAAAATVHPDLSAGDTTPPDAPLARIDAHGTVWHQTPDGHWHHRIYGTRTLTRLDEIFGQTELVRLMPVPAEPTSPADTREAGTDVQGADSETLTALAQVYRATAADPDAIADLTRFAGGVDAPAVLTALARLCEIAAGTVDEADPDWRRVREINAARLAGDTTTAGPDWRAEADRLRAEFARETRRTSTLMRALHDEGHRDDPAFHQIRPCRLCRALIDANAARAAGDTTPPPVGGDVQWRVNVATGIGTITWPADDEAHARRMAAGTHAPAQVERRTCGPWVPVPAEPTAEERQP